MTLFSGRVSLVPLAGEPGARRVSPLLLLLVILTFFLVFAGVSCNPTTTRSALAVDRRDSGRDRRRGRPGERTASTRSTGSTSSPTAAGSSPSGGTRSSGRSRRRATRATRRAPTPRRRTSGRSSWRSWRWSASSSGCSSRCSGVHRPRGSAEQGLGYHDLRRGGGCACSSSTSFHVRDVLLSKISSSEGSSIPGLDTASLFNVNPGIGLIAALVILGVTVVYNLVGARS